MIDKQIAPDTKRTRVKLAASIPVCFSASRQSSEFPANAIMASTVRRKTFVILSEVEWEGPLIFPRGSARLRERQSKRSFDKLRMTIRGGAVETVDAAGRRKYA